MKIVFLDLSETVCWPVADLYLYLQKVLMLYHYFEFGLLDKHIVIILKKALPFLNPVLPIVTRTYNSALRR
jgi:hypothetical protein